VYLHGAHHLLEEKGQTATIHGTEYPGVYAFLDNLGEGLNALQIHLAQGMA
jgi:hypothetical protein